MTASPASYTVQATIVGDGTAIANVNGNEIRFDSSPTPGSTLPGPADLLTAAFAACVLKNVERVSATLKFQWTGASIEVRSERQDTPPRITRIDYQLTVTTNETPRRVELLHRNITKFGTIYNTLAASCDVHGEITAVATSPHS